MRRDSLQQYLFGVPSNVGVMIKLPLTDSSLKERHERVLMSTCHPCGCMQIYNEYGACLSRDL